MKLSSTLTTKGQITIPKQVRDKLKIKAGDTVSYVLTDHGVTLVPRNRPVESIFGILEKFAIPGTSLSDYDTAIREGVVDHVGADQKKEADDAA